MRISFFLAIGIFVVAVLILLFVLWEVDEFESEARVGPRIQLIENGSWEAPVSSNLHQSLRAKFQNWQDSPDVTALSVSFKSARLGSWSSHPESNSAPLFWWGSVGKLVTSTLVLQAVADGQIAKTDPAATYDSNLPSNIEIGHLLHHTSGLPSFERMDWIADRKGAVSREEIFQQALSEEAQFDPGEGWDYSNTGYRALEAILESALGRPYATLVEQNIASPLGLKNFYALQSEIPPSVTYPDLGNPMPATSFAPNVGGAGNIVATAEDMANFWYAIMSGRIVSEKTLNQGQDEQHSFYGNPYMFMGAGLITYISDGTNEHWFGHGGGADQVAGLVIYSPSKNLIVSIVGIGENVPTFSIADELVQFLSSEN